MHEDKEYTCYIGVDQGELVTVVKGYDNFYYYYNSFLYLIEDIGNSSLTRKDRTSNSLEGFVIIFQFTIIIKNTGNSDNNDTSNLELKIVSTKIKKEYTQYIKKLNNEHEKIGSTNNQKYNILVNDCVTQFSDKSALMLFTFILNFFFTSLDSEENIDFEKISWDTLLPVNSESSYNDKKLIENSETDSVDSYLKEHSVNTSLQIDEVLHL